MKEKIDVNYSIKKERVIRLYQTGGLYSRHYCSYVKDDEEQLNKKKEEKKKKKKELERLLRRRDFITFIKISPIIIFGNVLNELIKERENDIRRLNGK